MSNEMLTHKDLAGYLQVSETTVKSYRRKFPGCIPVASNGKPIRFTPEAKKVCKKIRDFFELGMNISEVRSRLAAEFSWIQEQSTGTQKDSTQRPDNLSANMSDIAKSMVNLATQQKMILQRVQGIESFLEDFGVDKDILSEEERKKRTTEKKVIELRVENRLDQLDVATQELSHKIALLAQGIETFIYQQHEKERLQKTISEPEESAYETHAENSGKNIYQSLCEPPRNILSQPLFVSTAEGRLVSAGGRNRGSFSVNDLKALLVYGFTPPQHYSLEWIPSGSDWWLGLQQKHVENGNSIQLLLQERVMQKGDGVEITQVVNNGVSFPAIEFLAIIDALLSQ